MYTSLITLVLTLSSASAATPLSIQKDVPDRKPMDTAPEDISGYYICKGKETNGKTYSGVCVITRTGDVYLVQWIVGGSSYAGLGVRQGDTFAASWSMATDKGVMRGVNVYRVEAGPRLTGRWASLPGNGRLQDESLTFLKAIEEDED